MRSHPARVTRLKGITAHRAPHSECPKPCGFGKLASPANQRLDRFSLPVGQTKRNTILACAEPVILLPGRPFTLTHIHEICTEFNEGYTLQRMANYGYASGNRSVRSTQARYSGTLVMNVHESDLGTIMPSCAKD